MGSKNHYGSKMEDVLKNVYYNIEHPASFSGVLKLSKATKVPIKKTKEWLATQDTYTLHKPVRYKFQRRKVLSYGIGDLLQCDLIDLSKFAKYNKGVKYLLTAIDVFSKYGYAIPLKNKNAVSLLAAFKSLFKKLGVVKVKHVNTDKGKEFFNSALRKFFVRKGVNHYATHSEYKASVVERFNRTLKNKLYRIFTYRNSFKYLDILNSVLQSYNNSVHSSTGYPPSQVKPQDQGIIFERLYGYRPMVRHDFRVGDRVRISKAKKVFRRGYLPNWTEEVFEVYKCFSKNPPTFLLQDLKGNVLKGRFYAHELQKVYKTSKDYWRVEKILRSRGKGAKKEYFVKWMGYDDSYNTWITKKAFKKSWMR